MMIFLVKTLKHSELIRFHENGNDFLPCTGLSKRVSDPIIYPANKDDIDGNSRIGEKKSIIQVALLSYHSYTKFYRPEFWPYDGMTTYCSVFMYHLFIILFN